MMRIFLVLAMAGTALSFAPAHQSRPTLVSLKMGYVPDGMTPEQWKKYQQAEKDKQKSKNFAAVGPQSFKSRSLQSFQTDLEKGKAKHLLPVMFAKDRVKKGEIKQEDVPYMQRGGSWDNSDVKGAKRKSWNDIDKKQQGPATKKGIDWTGSQARRGGPAAKKGPEKPATKKLFGMF